MSAYLPALIWSLSNVVCLVIARRRSLKTTALRVTLAVLLGPLVIPYVLAAKSDLAH